MAAKSGQKTKTYRPGGKPFRLSASCINNWDCKYSGYLTHIKRRRPDYTDTINTVFGSSFHDVMETAFKHSRVDPLFLERAFFAQFDRNVARAKMQPSDIRRVNRFRYLIPEVVSNAIDLCQSCDLMRKPVETEKKHILKYRGWQVAVVIDLLMDDSEGFYHVFDWKTGQARNWDEGRDLTAEDVDGHVQLTLYHLAVHRIFGRAPASLNLLYPRDTLRLNLEPRKKSHFSMLTGKMDAIIECAEKFEKTGDQSLFPTSPSADACRFCDHKDICSDVHPDALKPPSARRVKLGTSGFSKGKKKRRSVKETVKNSGVKVRRPKREA